MSARVDVHAHLVPPGALSRLPERLRAETENGLVHLVADTGERSLHGAHPVLMDHALQRAEQEARGVDVSLLSAWMDFVQVPLPADGQHAWCATLNDELAAAVRGTAHSRFLAALPDLDGGRAAEELERAYALGAVGGALSSSPANGILARTDLDRLWEAAVRLDCPIVLHPGYFRPPAHLDWEFLWNLVGNPYETTLTAAALMVMRVPERFPELKLVLCHGGGFLPYQFGRIEAGFRRWNGAGADGVGELLGWFHYDTVLLDDRPTRYLLELVGPERVLAGTDCPFMMTDDRAFADPASLGLDARAAELVGGGNAIRLFGLDGGS